MSVLGTGVCETAQWAIVDTLYFDSARHRFVRGDLEIDGSRIARVLGPRTSQRPCALAGNATVCLPGLINADVGCPDHNDWQRYSQELALHGVTTAGVFCRSIAECAAYGAGGGVRRLLYVELAEGDGADTDIAAAAQRVSESFVRVADAFGPACGEILPAIVPGEIWSAQTLLCATSIAEQLGRRLCVRLGATPADAKRYRETRYFSEIGLLSYLSVLSRATIFNLSQLTRSDVAMVNESSANLVCAPGAVSELLLEPHFARLSLKDRALAFSTGHDALACADCYGPLMVLSTALLHASCDAAAKCNLVADALTHSAAQALGIADIGAIAAGMKADLCLFERPAYLAENGDGRDFVRLIAHSKPRDVLIDGAPLVLDGFIVREREPVPARAHVARTTSSRQYALAACAGSMRDADQAGSTTNVSLVAEEEPCPGTYSASRPSITTRPLRC